MVITRSAVWLGACALVALAPWVSPAQADGIVWRTNLDAAKVEATQTNRLLVVHFWRPSCGPCRVLDQTVFNQPHVGAALEQSYVPVKVDTDSSPALAEFFRINQVPTDVVMDSQGQVLASLPCPMKPDAYLAQLENLAQHWRQTTGPAAAGAAPVNRAYAGLPVRAAAPPMPPTAAAPSNATAAPPAATVNRYATSATPPAPQSQSNPFVASAPAAGQAKAMYAATASSAPASAAPPVDAVGPAVPATAMPRSYQPLAAAPPTAAAPAAPSAGPFGASTASAQVATAAPGPDAAASSAALAAAAPAVAATVAGPPRPPASQTIELPAGCPPLAFDGCCPVTLKGYKKWATGNVAYGAVHRGRTYLFVGPQERDQFIANPDAYSPVFGGLDPVMLLEGKQTVAGSRKFGYEYDGRFYLFANKESMDKFAASAPAYAAGVRQAMNRIDAAAGGTVRR